MTNPNWTDDIPLVFLSLSFVAALVFLFVLIPIPMLIITGVFSAMIMVSVLIAWLVNR